jgi:TRAP-type C4-dicarboxylate transport system permease small subunit
LIGAAIGVSERAHFTLHLVNHRFSLPLRRAIHVATYLLVAAFGALAGWYGLRLAIVNSQLTSPALELNLAWLYAAPAVGGVLIVLYGLAVAFEPPSRAEVDDIDSAAARAAGDD